MPELPEVETTRKGISPFLVGKKVTGVVVRDYRLRQPITTDLDTFLVGKHINSVLRRGKYLLLKSGEGHLMIHLGMSGSLRVVPASSAPEKHDHFDLVVGSKAIRLRDPRRFGLVLWIDGEPEAHPLLNHLGPEPLDDCFNSDYLWKRSHKRKVAVKNFIMNSSIVVGVGNIYASESLFMAGIRPGRQAGRVTKKEYQRLSQAIKQVLRQSIAQGGTTLRDFQNEQGNPGYFAQELKVYGKEGEPCPVCGSPIKSVTIGQRSSFYCRECQK